jgi:hypothetical protein
MRFSPGPRGMSNRWMLPSGLASSSWNARTIGASSVGSFPSTKRTRTSPHPAAVGSATSVFDAIEGRIGGTSSFVSIGA